MAMNRGSLAARLVTLEEKGIVRTAEQISDRVTLVKVRNDVGWPGLSQLLSLELGGQFWKGSRSSTWLYGKESHWLISPKSLQGVESARRIVTELTGDDNPPWSESACARRLLGWLGVRQTFWRDAEIFKEGAAWHYQRCHPNVGRGSLPYGYLWDIESCYHSLFERMPSPWVTADFGQVAWCPLRSEEEDRWRKILRAIKPHKTLRNALFGCCYGGRGLSYSKGKGRLGADRAGPLRGGALLVIRTAFELCALAAESSGAVYSNADCVISADPYPPGVWIDAGLKVRLQAEGDSEICSVGSYRVGDRATRNYWKGHREGEAFASLRVDAPRFSRWVFEA